MILFDTHSHLHFQAFKDDRVQAFARARAANVLVNLVGTQKDTSRQAVMFAEQNEGFYASIGLHPNHLFSVHIDEAESDFISREEDFDLSYYRDLAKSPKVIAIGECGLDYYRLPAHVDLATVRAKQERIFRAHVDLALELNLPLVIHCREAHQDLISVLRSYNQNFRGTVHCYTGDWEIAEQYLDLGLHLGFTGVITYPAKKTDPTPQENLLEVVKKIPFDRLLLETDAPYLAPQSHRGERNESALLVEVAQFVAEVRGISLDEVARLTTDNAFRLFNLKNT